MLESSLKPFSIPGPWKNSSMKPVLNAKKVGDGWNTWPLCRFFIPLLWNGHSVVTGTQRFLSPQTFTTWVENYTAEAHTERVIDPVIHSAHPHCFLIFSSHVSIRIKFQILVKNCFTASHRQIVNFLLYLIGRHGLSKKSLTNEPCSSVLFCPYGFVLLEVPFGI